MAAALENSPSRQPHRGARRTKNTSDRRRLCTVHTHYPIHCAQPCRFYFVKMEYGDVGPEFFKYVYVEWSLKLLWHTSTQKGKEKTGTTPIGQNSWLRYLEMVNFSSFFNARVASRKSTQSTRTKKNERDNFFTVLCIYGCLEREDTGTHHTHTRKNFYERKKASRKRRQRALPDLPLLRVSVVRLRVAWGDCHALRASPNPHFNEQKHQKKSGKCAIMKIINKNQRTDQRFFCKISYSWKWMKGNIVQTKRTILLILLIHLQYEA